MEFAGGAGYEGSGKTRQAWFAGDGRKQSPQQEACLYRQKRQKRVVFHSPGCFWKPGSRISADFAGWMVRKAFCGRFQVGILIGKIILRVCFKKGGQEYENSN